MGRWTEINHICSKIVDPRFHICFTPQIKQSSTRPNVTRNRSMLPLERRRIASFDTHFYFSPHIETINTWASSRIHILKALAVTSWGQQKETLHITDKSLIRSFSMHTSPIWIPNAFPSMIKKLQAIQNCALRVATGCVMIFYRLCAQRIQSDSCPLSPLPNMAPKSCQNFPS